MSRRVLARWWAIAVVGALALAVTPFALADRDDDDDDAKDKGKLAFAQRDDDDDDDDDGRKGREKANTYRVTIRNLTSGQPLSPPVVATHRGEDELFEVGEPASVGVREIAENGNNAPILAFLGANPFGAISDFESSSVPLFPEGTPGGVQDPPSPPEFPDEVTLTLTADKHARHLSLVTMLVCTNDGFTGVNSLDLPKKAGQSVTVRTNGYDAHTEVNDEDLAHIVPPCQLIGVSSGEPGMEVSNPALAEGGVIEHHEGIKGGSDLVRSVHGWTDPVAEIKVTAVG
jgi:hypothetical protein